MKYTSWKTLLVWTIILLILCLVIYLVWRYYDYRIGEIGGQASQGYSYSLIAFMYPITLYNN